LELIAFQASPSLPREGLPYWIFWLLLCLVLLLLFFIFLRDKALRMRLSYFLAGAKRRSLLIQLRRKTRKENQKRSELLKKLGAKAWDEDIAVDGSSHVCAELEALFEKKNASQAEWKRAFAEVERLHKKLEGSILAHDEKINAEKARKQPFDDLMKRKNGEEKALKKVGQDREIERQVDEVRREKEVIQKSIDEFEDAIKEIEAEGRSQRREIEKETRYWSRRKEKVQDRIKDIEAEEEELHMSLGQIVEEKRVESQGLGGLYAQIDDINNRIATLQHRIETLTGV
jgi:chromosome segregation ATPase